MLSLIQSNLPVLAVALLVGIATGRWLSRRPPSSGSDSEAP